MAKIKKMLVVAAILLTAGCDEGSVFNGQQTHTDATTRIESAGCDLRVYEFTPQTADHMQCVFVAGTRKGGLYCFEKKGSKHRP